MLGDGVALFDGGVGIDLIGADEDVLDGGEPGEQRRGLEDDAAIGSGFGHFVIAKDDVSTGLGREAGDHGEDGGFATAGVANQGDEFALGQGEVKVADDDMRLAAVCAGGRFCRVGGIQGIYCSWHLSVIFRVLSCSSTKMIFSF